MELVRMLLAARGLAQEDVTVVTGVKGTKELQGWIKRYGGLERAEYITEHASYLGGRDRLEPLLVSEGAKKKIVMADECYGGSGGDHDWRWLAGLTATADIIVCAKPSSGYVASLDAPLFVVTPPCGPHVLPFLLGTPHRQGWQPGQLYKYVTSHFGTPVLRSDKDEAPENLPDDLPLLWLDVKQEGWRQEEVVREVMREVMDQLGEEAGQKTGIWIQDEESEEVTGLPKSWRALEWNSVHGIEAEVTCSCGAV